MVMNNMENLELRYLERGYFCFREKFFVFLFFFFLTLWVEGFLPSASQGLLLVKDKRAFQTIYVLRSIVPLKPSKTLWGSWAQKPFCVHFSEFQKAGSNSC